MRTNLEAFRAFVAEFTRSGEASRRGRLELAHPVSGKALPVEVVSGTVRGAPGEPAMVVSVFHDLATQVENERLYQELKRFSEVLEARVRAATADLADQNARLQWQSRELEKANRLKSEFLASMSHELRTPINALIGYTALMLDRVYGELTPKQEEGLRRAQAAAQHLLALINDILDLAKIEAGRMPVHLESVAVPAVVREVAVQVEPMARTKKLEFLTDVAPELPAVETDPTKLTQILLNLASNALKFTSAGRVTLRAAPADGGQRVRFEVSDTGIGIRAEDLGVIWEDFRQLDQSRTREFGGTGLGLSIVKKLADRLGAEVGVASEVGVGSTFWVEVPVAGARD
jgi:signal transduction histidine kinase